ncbi:hypothetical protein GA0070615_2907 [Micromonospora aurantiaca]|nr:hypothetical protein GA0070615_2907 [Micromonospora aurantiaca]
MAYATPAWLQVYNLDEATNATTSALRLAATQDAVNAGLVGVTVVVAHVAGSSSRKHAEDTAGSFAFRRCAPSVGVSRLPPLGGRRGAFERGDRAMSLTDTIGADLQAMTAGVDRSQQETAAVDRAIEQIAARAVASGFIGITAGLARVREVIGQARSRLSEASGVLSEASRSVGSVAQQPSPQETIAALTPVVAAMNTVDGSVAAAASAVDEARRLVVAALQGGQPGPTLARLQQVMQILAAVRTRRAEARGRVDAALAQARQVGELGN